MNKKYLEIIKKLGKNRVKINELIAGHTTFKIGGPADLFYEARAEEELITALKTVREQGIPYFILGGGSNILVGDKGFRGIVIKCKMSNIKYQVFNDKVVVLVETGVPVSVLLNELTKNSVAGLEFMAGIPGTMGATVACNAGAWQKSLSETVLRVKILTKDGKIKWIDKKDCEFDYRTSKFKGGDDVILAVELGLVRGSKKTIEEQIAVNLEKRKTQPKEASAGCVFVNPNQLHAGVLIEKCGLKGTRIGGAKVSEKHANFIVNSGKAKASDVAALIDLVKKRVKEKFNIDLKEEILRVGEF